MAPECAEGETAFQMRVRWQMQQCLCRVSDKEKRVADVFAYIFVRKVVQQLRRMGADSVGIAGRNRLI